MTIHAPATHTLNHQTTEHLLKALAVVVEADLEGIITRARETQGTVLPEKRRGPRAKFVAYTATALACTMYELKASARPASHKEMLDALWLRYTEAELGLIGLEGLRDPDRLAAMTPDYTGMSPEDKRTAITKAQRVYEAEYQRLVVAFDGIFAPIDDTPIKANHRRNADDPAARNRPTITEVKKAAQRAELKPKRAAKLEVLGALIAASLRVENRDRHGDTDVFTGILADYRGHVAVDETHIIDALGDLPKGTAPGNYLSRLHGHTRDGGKKGYRAAVGLTLALTTADPGQDYNVPELCLGASIHHPTGGLGDAVREILHAIQSTGLSKSGGSNHAQYWIFDGGYTENKDLNVDLSAAGLGMVMKYAKGRRVLFEIGAVNNPDGTKADGVYLFNGVPLCPGASRRRLEELTETFKKPEEARMTDQQLLAHAETIAELEPLRMRTNGRPQLVPLRKRGGQSKTTAPAEPEMVMKVTVTCPMVSGTARCPVFDEFKDEKYANLPEVPDAPIHLDDVQRPACCRNANGNMTLNVPLKAFKTWQDFMVGSFEHADWYSGPRSNDERYNSLLKRAHGGADLSRRSIAPRKAAFHALTLAVSIAVTNRRALQTFEAGINTRGGTKPVPPGKQNKARRKARLAAARATGRTQRVAA
ncbi:hypothetical protein [Nocardioides sp. LS1]|uniref:hypothetical protein n=1 Tax=Nocardioides sp. LS1 TaxID=1027620 RepID=UPI000F619389|nr:hypothetical protein [Nocardioides sp. LS1]GCD90128.1 hypothetical protein NLS1_21340 [Nocardioides sp. LS1]